jgi:hypothetical protein
LPLILFAVAIGAFCFGSPIAGVLFLGAGALASAAEG